MEPKSRQEQVENFTAEQSVDLEISKELAAGYAPEDIQQSAQILEDPEMAHRKRRYMWKLDSIILPTVSALYFFEYLDRGNIAVGSSAKHWKERGSPSHRTQNSSGLLMVTILRLKETAPARRR